MGLAVSFPFKICVPVLVPALVPRLTKTWILPPGPVKFPVPEVCTAPGLKDTEYAVPAEQVTLADDVVTSVPVTAVILPKFMLETVMAQAWAIVTLVVKAMDLLAATALCAIADANRNAPIPALNLPPKRIYGPCIGNIMTQIL